MAPLPSFPWALTLDSLPVLQGSNYILQSEIEVGSSMRPSVTQGEDGDICVLPDPSPMKGNTWGETGSGTLGLVV